MSPTCRTGSGPVTSMTPFWLTIQVSWRGLEAFFKFTAKSFPSSLFEMMTLVAKGWPSSVSNAGPGLLLVSCPISTAWTATHGSVRSATGSPSRREAVKLCHLTTKAFWHVEPGSSSCPASRGGICNPIDVACRGEDHSHRPRTCVLSTRTVISLYGGFSWPAQGTSGPALKNPCIG